MPIWKWEEKFTDVRECAVEAETLEEAQEKMESGDWFYEHTVNFYSEELMKPLDGPFEE